MKLAQKLNVDIFSAMFLPEHIREEYRAQERLKWFLEEEAYKNLRFFNFLDSPFSIVLCLLNNSNPVQMQDIPIETAELLRERTKHCKENGYHAQARYLKMISSKREQSKEETRVIEGRKEDDESVRGSYFRKRIIHKDKSVKKFSRTIKIFYHCS